MSNAIDLDGPKVVWIEPVKADGAQFPDGAATARLVTKQVLAAVHKAVPDA